MLHEELIKLKKQSKETYITISKKSGIAQSTVAKIFAGTIENPSFVSVMAIVHAMGFSLSDLDPSAKDALTYDEQNLLKAYRQLSTKGKNHLTTVLDSLTAYEAEKPMVMREIPLYLLSASAGVGSYLDSDSYDYEAFPAEIIPPNTKFAIRVMGDSMEPAFYTDDIVFVYPTQRIEENDIVILTINGDGYIKEYHPDGFYSLNTKYAPIRPTEYDEVRIIGKVVGKYNP